MQKPQSGVKYEYSNVLRCSAEYITHAMNTVAAHAIAVYLIMHGIPKKNFFMN